MKYKITHAYGVRSVWAATRHGDVIVANISCGREGYYIRSIRGVYRDYTQHHATLEEACEEAYNKWNTHGRIYINE